MALIGVTPRQLSLWETLTTMAILFHHSNIRLPLAIERALARVVVTPRMHGIPAFRRAEEVRFGRLLRMPFAVQRPSWRLGGFGPKPERQEPLPSERAARAAASAP